MLEEIYNKVKTVDLSVAEVLQESNLCKEDLIANVDKGDALSLITLLLGTMTHRVMIWMEDFEDEDTEEILPIKRVAKLDGMIFESSPEEIHQLILFLHPIVKDLSDDTLIKCWELFERDVIPFPIVSELAGRGFIEAIEWMGDYYAGDFPSVNACPIDKDKAQGFYNKALETGLDKTDYDIDVLRLEYGLKDRDFDWVYGELNLDFDSENDWSFEGCCASIIGSLRFYRFPSPMAKSTWDDPVYYNCSLKDLKDELLSRGVSESAFRTYKQGILVDMPNLSYYLVTGPEDEQCVPEGALGVAPHFREIEPRTQYHFLMDEAEFSAKEFADIMFELDKKVPAVKVAVALIYDKLIEEKNQKEKKQALAEAYLKDILKGDTEQFSVELNYDYRPNDYGKHKYCREILVVKLSECGSLQIEYDDLKRLSKDVFSWCLDRSIYWGEVIIRHDKISGKDHLFVNNHELPSDYLVS